MPQGYLVTLGNGSLDPADAIGGSIITFTTAANLGAGTWTWSGTFSGTAFTNTVEPGVYYTATNGGVYFVPDYGPVTTISSAQATTAPAYSASDGIVSGTGGDDIMNSAYNGDPQGDRVTQGNDTIQAGAGNDTVFGNGGNDSIDGGSGNDTVYGGAGNDTITGGLGTDTIYGEAGNDSISGGDGNDVIYGDTVTNTTGTGESLNWISQGPDGTNIAGGFTQDTGGMNVTAGFVNNGGNVAIQTSSDTQYVGTGPYATNSGLFLQGNAGPNSTTTLTFNSEPGSGLTNSVSNANFIINDIDQQGWQDVITVRAYGYNAAGVLVEIPVTFTVLGNDSVSGNTITGGNGNDSEANAAGAVRVNIAGPVHSIQMSYANAGTGNQWVWVTDVHYTTIYDANPIGNDSIDGGLGNDIIYGEGGNDTLVGGAGNDQLYGGAGNDSIDGGAGNDSLYGGDGNDLINDSGTTADYIDGGSGNDTVNAGAGNDIVYGGAGDDNLMGQDGEDVMYGGVGNDTVDGDAGNDILYGDAGNDVIIGDDGNDSMYGGVGDDGIYSTSGNNYAEGGDGNDSIYMGTGNDVVYGGNNNDNIFGGAGNDSLFGDAGNDTLFGGAGNDTLTGGAGNDSINAGTGSDRIVLGDGFGTDSIDGAEDVGNTDTDILDGSAMTTATTVNMSGPEAGTLTSGGNTATFSNIENIVTGAGNDSITGSTGADTITTGAGADRINAGAGNDQINLGAGTATDGAADVVVLQDGSGSDIIRGFDGATSNGNGTFTGIDTLDVTALFDLPAGNPARTPVRTNDVVVTNDGSGNAVLTFPNGETITLIGISPAVANNPFYLNAIGIPMPDGTVQGTAGSDVINGSYTGDPDGDRVDGNDAILAGDTGNDDLIYGYAGNDIITAGDGNDEVYGGADNDSISGGVGNDTLFGGAGNDTLTGGAGNDSINAGTGSDRIVVGDNDGADIVAGGEDVNGLDNDTLDLNDQTTAGGTNVVLTGNEAGTYAFNNGPAMGSFTEIETFDLTDSDDTFDGSAATSNATVIAGAGNDIIIAGSGDDSIAAGSGDDSVQIGDNFGNDVIVGGEAGETDGDVLDGSDLTQNVTVDFSGAEAGTISNGVDTATFSEIEQVITGAGNDTITGGAGNENVITGAGDDTVNSTGAGADTIATGAGNDTITFSEGDSIDGGIGDDTFNAEDLGEPTNGGITIVGGTGGETLGDGDTLNLGTLANLSTLVKISDGINADGNETFHGSVTMDDGTILTFSEIENIICFTPGTRIATPQGARDIATLRVGDMVVTRDHGLRPIRWIAQRTVPAMDRFAPIRIRPGVVTGQERDLLVSPQHRMMFQGYRAELLFGESEVLVAAKHLVDGKFVTQDVGGDVTYIHMMFDEHEVVYAEGAATESFHPGDIGLTALSDPAREELFALFPELRSNVNGYGQTARRCLKRHETELLVL